MKKIVAIPTVDRVHVDSNFGHTKEFIIYTIDGDTVKHEYVTPPTHGPGVVPTFLLDRGVNVVITNHLGPKALEIFTEHTVNIILGAVGTIESNIQKYIRAKLESKDPSGEHRPHEEYDKMKDLPH